MRTTIDLPDDLHKVAMGIARDQRISLSEAVATILRRGLGEAGPVTFERSESTGLVLFRSGRTITAEDVRSLDDDE